MPKASPRFILIALLLLLFFTYPLLSLANRPVFVGGFPLMYLYVGAIWIVAIVLLFLTTRSLGKDDE